MKNSTFYKMQIRQNIRSAKDIVRVRFGFDICMRLFSEYKAIGEQGYLPGIEIIDMAVKSFYNYLEFQLFNDNENREIINQVELISPITDNLSQAEASCVINTLSTIKELLMYLGDKDYDHICNISDLMINTTEFKILDTYEEIQFESIPYHPIFINEAKHQLEIFNN